MTRMSVKSLLAATFSLCILFFSNALHAQHDTTVHDTAAAQEAPAHARAEGGFNVTETILEHIKDDHSWHLWGHTSLPLPVILYTDKGLELFSSAKLVDEHHEPVVYAGNYTYKTVEGKVRVVNADGTVNEEASKKVWDFSITKNVTSLFITVALLLIVFLSVAKAYRKTGVKSAPKGLQSLMEPIILFIRDEVAKPNIGHRYARYTPFLLTIFFLILVNNFLGLIPFFPGGANVSGNIAFTMTLAVCVFILVNLNGNKSYWEHIFWMPGMHWSMKLFLAPIELIGVFTKPISLMIRLFANITAGHILVLSLICLIFIFKTVVASAIAVPFAVFISLIELLVAFLQAYIFTMLSAMYIGMATEEHHHHGDHEPHYHETED
ncbi:F0F1 ATP synthase subunit A [Sediminibacterium soli]|uniref:F0F1 ATP synthase subunit A n=1 Tax=Sediminibacterium soli TaxID=2698829 RepID=UPI00137987A2|nr:F0F1 ATP synthase subunit A [Sediminibacterium soli]NCI45476.1 F0F1 ATP synthase subunit A [Sediminibacterium soli]